MSALFAAATTTASGEDSGFHLHKPNEGTTLLVVQRFSHQKTGFGFWVHELIYISSLAFVVLPPTSETAMFFKALRSKISIGRTPTLLDLRCLRELCRASMDRNAMSSLTTPNLKHRSTLHSLSCSAFYLGI